MLGKLCRTLNVKKISEKLRKNNQLEVYLYLIVKELIFLTQRQLLQTNLRNKPINSNRKMIPLFTHQIVKYKKIIEADTWSPVAKKQNWAFSCTTGER